MTKVVEEFNELCEKTLDHISELSKDMKENKEEIMMYFLMMADTAYKLKLYDHCKHMRKMYILTKKL